MGKVEMTSLQDTINDLNFYGRYVDDIFCLTDVTTDTDALVQKFNNALHSLTFSAEFEADNEIAFLDVLQHRQEDGSIQRRCVGDPDTVRRLPCRCACLAEASSKGWCWLPGALPATLLVVGIVWILRLLLEFCAMADGRPLVRRVLYVSKWSPEDNYTAIPFVLYARLGESTQLAVLGRGATFNTADAAPPEFIAAFESVLQLTQTSEETKELIRHKTSFLLMQHKKSEILSKEEQQALKSLKADKDIIILPADKGRSTVVLDKSDYQKKALSLLDDPQSYKLCPASEMKNLLTQINKSLAKLRANGAITAKDWFHMKPSDSAAARFYGLPKVHKADIPLRPIVSLRGTPTYGLAKWMFARLKFLAEGSPTTEASATQFLERLKHLKLESDESMVSFDVVSLFTSIPQQLAIDVVRQLLADRYNERDNPLKTEHPMELLRHCLKTYLTFGGQMYEQIKGTPMGSPISGLIAEVVLQRIEHLVFTKYQPKFWARYVDDTFAIVKSSDVEHLKELLNSVDPNIEFTMEAETNNQLPFLDVLVLRCATGQLQTTVFRKATNTRQILHFNSNHPLSHKRSCVRTLFQRVETHCSTPADKRVERQYLHDLFRTNGYPSYFIKQSKRRVNRRRPKEEQLEV
ncbi:hypothetical protein SprV_0301046500 [Sparganum proliferum]